MSALPAGYTIQSERKVNSGTLYFARKNGRDYVVKEFFSHRFCPDDKLDVSPRFADQYRQAAAFLSHLETLRDRLQTACRLKGPLNIPQEVFRHQLFIFKSTLLIKDCGIPSDQLHEHLRPEQIDQLVKSVLLQLEKLEGCGFVHCDIKPDNLMVHERSGIFTASMIDYEGGLFPKEPLPERDISFTPEYASPELANLIKARGAESPDPAAIDSAKARLSTASDVFSLGLIYHLYLTGRLPVQYREGIHARAVFDKILLNIPIPLNGLHPARRVLIERMLAGQPDARPTPRALIDQINQAQTGGLMDCLDTPFAAFGRANPLSDSAPGLQGQAGFLMVDGAKCLVRHLHRDWMAKAADGTALPAWAHHNEAVLRRRQRRLEVSQILNLASQEGWMVVPFEVAERGRLSFAVSRVADGELLTFEALRSRFGDAAWRDRLMCAILNCMLHIHAQGLAHGGLGTDSFLWLLSAGELRTIFHDTPAWALKPWPRKRRFSWAISWARGTSWPVWTSKATSFPWAWSTTPCSRAAIPRQRRSPICSSPPGAARTAWGFPTPWTPPERPSSPR